MNEKVFRLSLIVLLAIFVGGSLYIGEQLAQNGRYIQFDERKFTTATATGATSNLTYKDWTIDTRTGRIVENGH